MKNCAKKSRSFGEAACNSALVKGRSALAGPRGAFEAKGGAVGADGASPRVQAGQSLRTRHCVLNGQRPSRAAGRGHNPDPGHVYRVTRAHHVTGDPDTHQQTSTTRHRRRIKHGCAKCANEKADCCWLLLLLIAAVAALGLFFLGFDCCWE